MSDVRSGWKLFTHDLCSPIQGGKPVWDGSLPFTTKRVKLDAGESDCSRGWNYVADIATGFGIVGLWSTGRPSRVFMVEASEDAIERKGKRRASELRIVREATEEEIRAGVAQVSEVFGVHAERMTDEQLAWRRALGRPRFEPAAVAAHLRTAVATRKLDWALKEYDSCRAARDAWAAWDARDAAWDAWAAWDARAAREAWDARVAWDGVAWDGVAWDARAAREAWAARDAWAAWAARDAREAWAAWAALIVTYAALNAWVSEPPELLTAGLREAYENGLGVAIPTGPNVLGYAMDEGTKAA